MLKKLSYALFGLVACVGLAVAGGNFNFWPIVGGAAYNCSTVNAVSVCTVPAGPLALTGQELIPADTQLAQGLAPQTVLIPSSSFQTGSMQVVTTNASVVIPNGVNSLVSNQGTATIALITLPSAPLNNQILYISNAGSGVLTITSLAAASGQSIVQGAAPASLAIQTNNSAAAAQSFVEYQYQASNTTWYRLK